MSPPSNPDLTRAIQDLIDAPSTEMSAQFRRVLDVLLVSTLIGAEDEDLATIETDDDEVLLVLFTDLIELHFFSAGARWISVSAEEAIRRVAADEYDGLVINPGAKQFQLLRDDVLDIFDIS